MIIKTKRFLYKILRDYVDSNDKYKQIFQAYSDGIKSQLGLESLCISCSDLEYLEASALEFYRGDLLILALELEYYARTAQEHTPEKNIGLYCNEPVERLVKKHNLLGGIVC